MFWICTPVVLSVTLKASTIGIAAAGARPALEYVTAHARAGDRVYCYYGSEAALGVYGPEVAGSSVPRVGLISRVRARDGWATFLAALRGSRTWFVFLGWSTTEEKNRMMPMWLDFRGARTDEFVCPAADVYLYDLKQDPGPLFTQW